MLSTQPIYACIENCYYKKTIVNFNYWIIIELLDNKTPKEESDNIKKLVIAGM